MRTAIGLALVPLVILTSGCNSPTGPTHDTTRITNPDLDTTPVPWPTPHETQTHVLTMTASPSCTALPDAAKKRTYPAQVQEKSNGDLLVWVVNSPDIMIGWGGESGFTGKRDGNTVRFDITDDIMAPYSMMERIPGVGDLGYFGTATGTIDGNGKIVATFNGQYRNEGAVWGSAGVFCEASDHRVEVAPM